MSSRFEPPKFIDDASGYAEYKKKLLRWSRITKVDPKQQAEVVLYHMEDHPSGIQEKIDTALGSDVEDKADGLEKLIVFLDGIYAEDEMTEAWSKYKHFIRLKKDIEQPVTEFIADFDKAHKRAKESGCEFSDIVLGFNLLESCNLSETDEKFVLTAVDFKAGKQNKNLLDQIKNSLRKFQSRERLSSSKDSASMRVKEEDSYVTNVKQALIVDGWRPPSRSLKQKSTVAKSSVPKVVRKKNPIGADGNILKCFRCQSEFHLKDKCDQRKKIAQNEETSMLSDVLKKSRDKMVYSMVCCVQDSDELDPLPQDEQEDYDLVLVSHDEQEFCLLIEEAGCRGVLDSACSKSVAGVSWVEKYVNSISPTFAETLKVSQSSKVYQFGGGEKRKSQGSITLPTVIGDSKVFITMDIVNASIPLLIGSNAMVAGGAILNFRLNKVTFFDEEVDMVDVGTGHFCIDLVSQNIETHINDVDVRNECVNHVLLNTEVIDKKTLKKLHHFYGHTPADRLLKFLENAGKDTKNLKELLLKIEKSCESCIRTKRMKPRPKSAIPRVEGPNDVVTIDLKKWTYKGQSRYICYMIDLHSRLTLGNFISDKNPDSVVKCIMQSWVPVFGLMQSMHSDIGGEFSNNVMEDVASKLGVKLTTTASYSPHQNGLNERNNAVVDMMITRMLCSDKNLQLEMALLWALNAKNSLENCFGFSPFQLHIGRNPILSSVTRDGPPSFETVSKSKSFAAHLNAMHSAREEFIRAESSQSLKKALKSRVYPKGDDIVEGDWIFYKKNDTKKKSAVWKGPSKVVSVNGKKLFVDQGARLSTVNRDDAVRKGDELWNMNDLEGDNDEEIEKGIAKVLTRVQQCQDASNSHVASSSDSESDEEDESAEGLIVNNEVAESVINDEEPVLSEDESVVPNGESVVDEAETEDIHELRLSISEEVESADDSAVDHQNDSASENQVPVDEEADYELVVETDRFNLGPEDISAKGSVDVQTQDSDDLAGDVFTCSDVRKNDIISYQIPESGVTEISKVLDRATKSTGTSRFWWNVEVQVTGEHKSVNAAAVKNLMKINVGTNSDIEDVPVLAVSVPRYQHGEPECIAAKEKELESWDHFGVYKEVNDIGQKILNTSWVLVKKNEGVKARLCIRGDQEANKESIRTDSPTINKVNIKLFYVLAGHLGWNVKTADVKTAFLQGASIERDVFVRPPSERRVSGVIWKMVKSVYGFVDASRGFYLELDIALRELGCVVSLYDPALYIFRGSDGLLKGILLTHVDDLLHGAGDDEFSTVILDPLKKKFTFGREEEAEFKYVGMHVIQQGSTITVDQDHYVDSLLIPDYIFDGNNDLDTLLNDVGQAEFRSAVGRISWVANSSRPDLSYDSLVLSMKIGNAAVRDMKMAVKILKKIKCASTSMKFVDLGPIVEWVLEGYGDAGFRSLPDKTSSCEGFVVLLSNKELGLSSVLTWRSNKIKRIVSSSTAAEALAANEALDGLVYVKCVLKELLGEDVDSLPLHLNTDSKNLHKAVQNSTLVENPRLRTDLAKLKESLGSGELKEFSRVMGKDMIADVLTKKGVHGFMLMDILRTGRTSSATSS